MAEAFTANPKNYYVNHFCQFLAEAIAANHKKYYAKYF